MLLLLCYQSGPAFEILLDDGIRLLWKLVCDEVGPFFVCDWGHCLVCVFVLNESEELRDALIVEWDRCYRGLFGLVVFKG